MKESAVALVSCLAGLLIVRLASYPDTRIDIGVGYAEREGQRVRAVLLDFDTPTIDQMRGHASVDDFDRWAVLYAGSHLPGVAELPLLRVSSLSSVSPDTIFHYALPFSGFGRMREQMLPPHPGILVKTWGVAFLPYAGVVFLRLVRRFVRRAIHK